MLRKTVIDRWVIDIGMDDSLEARSSHPEVMGYLEEWVLPKRQEMANKEEERNREALQANPKAKVNKHHTNFLSRWWNLSYRRADMLDSLARSDRYLATSRHASVNRPTVFAFVDSAVRPGDSMTAFALDDEYSFGVLSSNYHGVWVRARCSYLKADPRYTSSTVWSSFPWPQSPTPEQVEAIVGISARLLKLRQGYYERGIPLEAQYASLLRPGRNELRDLHEQLDEAVREAYGFTAEDDKLAQLFALNQALSGEEAVIWGPKSASSTGISVRVTDYRILPPVG